MLTLVGAVGAIFVIAAVRAEDTVQLNPLIKIALGGGRSGVTVLAPGRKDDPREINMLDESGVGVVGTVVGGVDPI